MGELTRGQRLFAHLLNLSNDDATLPAEVIVNLHRVQLRAPLLHLARLGETAVPHGEHRSQLGAITEFLHAHYPRLIDGKLFEGDEALRSLSAQEAKVLEVSSDWDLGKLQVAELTGSDLVAELVDAASWNWQAHEPLYTLHRLTWPGAPVPLLLQTLEEELSLDGQVADMILAFATVPALEGLEPV